MNKTEMREYLTGKGFTFNDNVSKMGTILTTINWERINAGYLYDDEVQIFNDTVYNDSDLISVPYTHPRCLERVNRIILYLKTADRRRERRMRRERANQVRAYFEGKKNLLRRKEEPAA